MITHTAITAITTVMARTSMNDYVRDPAEITRLSFAAIRREADLSALPEDIVPLALRMIHACGMTDGAAVTPYPGREGPQPSPSSTALNSRHSPLDMPELSCETSSPFSIRRTQSSALDDSWAPPMR